MITRVHESRHSTTTCLFETASDGGNLAVRAEADATPNRFLPKRHAGRRAATKSNSKYKCFAHIGRSRMFECIMRIRR